MELDEKGVLSSRPGSKVKASTGARQISAVAPVALDKQILLAASDIGVYRIDENGAAGLGMTLDGDYDPVIETVGGHALVTSGTAHYKYDGTTVRQWGIEAPLESPDLASSELARRTIATFDQSAAEFTAAEGSIAYTTGQDAVANAAVALTPAATGRGEFSYVFASPMNLLNFSGSDGGDFDEFEFWWYNKDPTKFMQLQIAFGCDTGTDPFVDNGYLYTIGSGLIPIGLTNDEIAQSASESKAADTAPGPETPPEEWNPHKDPDAIEQRREERRDQRQGKL